MIKQAVILAGGLGTRLKPFTNENPKPMYPIHGKPFLEYLIVQIKEWGIKDILILCGYKSEKIINYFDDGHKFGVNISYNITPIEYETGMRLKNAGNNLHNKFIMLYCDNYCPIDFFAAEEQFDYGKYDIQCTAYINEDGYTKNNLKYAGNKVLEYDKSRNKEELNAVDIGYVIMKKNVLDAVQDGNVNFESTVYPQSIHKGKMGCYITEHRYYSIGGWERMPLTEEFFRPKKVIFLDRDGTINKKPPQADYVKNVSEFHWIPKAREAIKLLKMSGYDIYLVSNQPGVAREKMTIDDLNIIQNKINSDLAEIGAKIDGTYYCTHGWNEGCNCRKPRPGLFFMAQKEHSLDLSKCILIGDDERDIQAGKAAGLKRNILLENSYGISEAVKELVGMMI